MKCFSGKDIVYNNHTINEIATNSYYEHNFCFRGSLCPSVFSLLNINASLNIIMDTHEHR